MNKLLLTLCLVACSLRALPATPVVAGEWWDIAGVPDLGEYNKGGQQPVDFAIWQAADGTWQLWSCIRGTAAGGHGRLFHRWEARHLTDTAWRPAGIAMMADMRLGEPEGGLQAPFVLEEGGIYYMFYGDWDRICLATSTDGKHFTRAINDSGTAALFQGPYQNTRDAMVLKSNGLFFCYYTGHTAAPPPGQDSCAVFCRVSVDLRSWSEPLVVCSGGSPSRGIAWYGADCECPFVVHRDGAYYLFRNQLYGGDGLNTLYASDNPLLFGAGDDSRLAATMHLSAPEIIEHEGTYYIAALKPGLDGIRLARLAWKEDAVAATGRGYHVDSRTGNDASAGTRGRPWRTLARAAAAPLLPGDTLYFARGSSYTGGVEITASGTADRPVVITASGEGDAPRFSNPAARVLSGNVFRVSGDHLVIDGLYFHDCAAAPDSASFARVWDVGAVRIVHGADHCTVRNCEFVNCPKGIQSSGEHALIIGNYLHDANARPLSYPFWGPIAIHLGNGHQEVARNVIRDYHFIGGAFGGDGGAIEIDDGRYPKEDIYIHHNYTARNMGFLEVSWFADTAKTETVNLRVEHNLSDDYQDFVMLWAPTRGAVIADNTILRVQQVNNDIVPSVFLCDYGGNTIRDNLVVVDSVTQVYTGKLEFLDANRRSGNVYLSVSGLPPNIGTPLRPSERAASVGPVRPGEGKTPRGW